jgi:hypothetical protein
VNKITNSSIQKLCVLILAFSGFSVYSQGISAVMSSPNLNFFDVCSKVDSIILFEDTSSLTAHRLSGAPELEDDERSNYYRWQQKWIRRIDETGHYYKPYAEYKKYLENGITSSCIDNSKSGIVWKNIGPDATPLEENIGYVGAIWVNPENSNIILAGSPSGGVFRSTDGGLNWVNTTDDEGFSLFGITDIVSHPQNSNIIYAATGNYAASVWNSPDMASSYGIGVIMSIDGGVSWKKNIIDL